MSGIVGHPVGVQEILSGTQTLGIVGELLSEHHNLSKCNFNLIGGKSSRSNLFQWLPSATGRWPAGWIT